MDHPTEETLNDYVERDLGPAEQVRVATHLDTCAECALFVAEVQTIVREASALGPMTPPPHVWTQIQARLNESRQVQHPATRDRRRVYVWRFAWSAATAALVVLAFLTGRFVNQREQAAPRHPAATPSGHPASRDSMVRERVLLIAVGDHLERSQMVLVELAHAETRDELDISSERQLADDLVASNRLYRQTAQQMGHASVAGLLDELERVLVEVARGPDTVSMQQLANLQQRIESQGILFKVRIVGSEIRKQPVS